MVQTASIGTPGEADVWARHATVSGGIKQGVDPEIEYKKRVRVHGQLWLQKQ